MNEVTMTKEEWIERAAAQYVKRSDHTAEECLVFAQAIFENTHDALNAAPEDEADEDMSYWDN